MIVVRRSTRRPKRPTGSSTISRRRSARSTAANVAKTVSFRDERTAALFNALGENDTELQQAVDDVRAAAGVDNDSPGDRSELLRLLVRVGLNEVTPRLAEAEKQARMKRIEDDY